MGQSRQYREGHENAVISILNIITLRCDKTEDKGLNELIGLKEEIIEVMLKGNE